MNRLEALSQVDRPVLGDTIPVAVFRVFRQFSALYGEDLLGEKGIKVVFTHAGRELGKEIGKSVYTDDFDEYLARVTKYVQDNSIGILKAVPSDKNKLILQLGECVTCAGMPNIGKKICHFEVGIVAGVVEVFLKKDVWAFESLCNANGDCCCEVTVLLERPDGLPGNTE